MTSNQTTFPATVHVIDAQEKKKEASRRSREVENQGELGDGMAKFLEIDRRKRERER